MQDESIVALYWDRDETAIEETKDGTVTFHAVDIGNILPDKRDE